MSQTFQQFLAKTRDFSNNEPEIHRENRDETQRNRQIAGIFEENSRDFAEKQRKLQEIRAFKAQAVEKEKIIEKRRKSVVIIQKYWRGFAQYCKFQAYK